MTDYRCKYCGERMSGYAAHNLRHTCPRSPDVNDSAPTPWIVPIEDSSAFPSWDGGGGESGGAGASGSWDSSSSCDSSSSSYDSGSSDSGSCGGGE